MKKMFCFLLSIIILFTLSGCKDSTNNNIKDNAIQKGTKEIIYSDDEAINLFINKYNENCNNKIASDMISKKHIGGRDRDNVISIANDKLEINIYNNFKLSEKYNISVYVGYKNNDNTTLEDYKEQFINFIKLFDNSLSNDDINYYWNDMTSSYHSNYEIKDIDIVLSVHNEKIEYLKLTRNLEF